MSRAAAFSIENNFVNGQVTEATALNFPENAVLDADNCVFSDTGIVERRLGLDFEEGFAYIGSVPDDHVLFTYQWKSAAGDGSNNFVVLQVGNLLRFLRIGPDSSLSSGLMASSVNLEDFRVAGSPATSGKKVTCASGYGHLIVTHAYTEPFYVSFNSSSETFTAKRVTVRVRDFEGFPRLYPDDISRRPTADQTTIEHYYNLYNQGWTPGRTGTFRSSIGVNPSDVDVWWLYKNTDDAFDPKPSIVNNIERGSSPAPRGRFIYNAFFWDRAAKSGVSGLPSKTSGFARPSTVEFFAGRAFYAGTSAEEYNTRLYFSQTIESPEQFGECYQVNDPTSETSFDLLPTDGGVINIPSISEIIRIEAVEGSLLVFATNGVWSITGSGNIGFSADDYTVRQLSSIGVESIASFVDVGGPPLWWTNDGIYAIRADQTLGTVQVVSITDQKIDTLFKEINNDSKLHAVGDFNVIDNLVLWLYSSSRPTSIKEQTTFDQALCLNTKAGSFFQWSFPADTKIRGIVVVKGQGTLVTEEDVIDSSGATVTDSADNAVFVPRPSTRNLQSVFKLLVETPSGLTFAEINNPTYLDFPSVNSGTSYDSFFITGYKLRGEGIRKWQPNYVQLFIQNDKISPSAFYFQALWDYANNSSTGRWTNRQYVNLPTANYDTLTRRLKVRGHGLACQFKIESVPTRPFVLAGWASYETGNQEV